MSKDKSYSAFVGTHTDLDNSVILKAAWQYYLITIVICWVTQFMPEQMIFFITMSSIWDTVLF